MRFIKIVTISSISMMAFIFLWFNLFISEQKRQISSFNSIHITGPINLYIQQAEAESLTVRSDSKNQDQVIIEVVDYELKIYTEGKIQRERVLDVYVSFKSLDEIHASGASTITSRGVLKGSTFKIKASLAAEVKIQLQVDSLNLIMDDHANVQLAGSATNVDLLITDVGDLMAYNLVSQTCKAIIDTGDQSPGIARINVEKKLDVYIDGPRHLKYKGDPVITNQTIKGKGKLIKH